MPPRAAKGAPSQASEASPIFFGDLITFDDGGAVLRHCLPRRAGDGGAVLGDLGKSSKRRRIMLKIN